MSDSLLLFLSGISLIRTGTQKNTHTTNYISHLKYSYPGWMLEGFPRLQGKPAYLSSSALIPIRGWSEVLTRKEIHTRGLRELPFWFCSYIGGNHLQVNIISNQLHWYFVRTGHKMVFFYGYNYIYPESNLKGSTEFSERFFRQNFML